MGAVGDNQALKSAPELPALHHGLRDQVRLCCAQFTSACPSAFPWRLIKLASALFLSTTVSAARSTRPWPHSQVARLSRWTSHPQNRDPACPTVSTFPPLRSQRCSKSRAAAAPSCCSPSSPPQATSPGRPSPSTTSALSASRPQVISISESLCCQSRAPAQKRQQCVGLGLPRCLFLCYPSTASVWQTTPGQCIAFAPCTARELMIECRQFWVELRYSVFELS